MSRFIPLCVAFIGVVMAIGNRKWAVLMMDNHRHFRGGVNPNDDQRWHVIYRIIAVVTGCFFAVSGILGALGLIAMRH